MLCCEACALAILKSVVVNKRWSKHKAGVVRYSDDHVTYDTNWLIEGKDLSEMIEIDLMVVSIS